MSLVLADIATRVLDKASKIPLEAPAHPHLVHLLEATERELALELWNEQEER